MKITLYKNCKLNSNYQEVFDCKRIDQNGETALDRYLKTLNNYEIELPYTYMTGVGTINLELENLDEWSNAYEFNYIKFEENNFVRYCFVYDIKLTNGICSFMYNEDVWHSYSKSLQITKGMLINGNGENYLVNKVRELPLEYQTNEPIQIKSLYNNIQTFWVFAICQKYSLSSGGDVSTRTCFPIALFPVNNGEIVSGRSFSIEEAISAIQAITTVQYEEIDKYYYEFDNFLLVPDEALDINQVYLAKPLNSKLYELNVLGMNEVRPYILGYLSNDEKRYIYLSKSYELNEITIPANYKNISIGSYKTNININNNGTDLKFSGTFAYTPFELKLILNINGQLIDVTSDFTIDAPYNSINGETFAQRKIARDIGNRENDLAFGTGMTNNTLNALGNIVGGGADILTGDISGAINSGFDIGQNIVNGVQTVGNYLIKYDEINAEKYQNTYGTFVTSNQGYFINYGFVLKYIIPDNEEEVQKAINLVGYKINEIVGNEVFDTEIDEDCIKFQSVNIYGNFSQKVNYILSNILINGVRIRYV